MAIGRVSGSMLVSNLDRQGTDLQFTTLNRPLVYLDFSQFRLGVNTNNLAQTVTINGNLSTSNVLIDGLTISAKNNNTLQFVGNVNLGSISNVKITGGANAAVISTDGNGNLTFVDPSSFAAEILGNAIQLGANTSGQLVSNAVTLTTSTSVTDSVAKLNQVLGKLVPPSPPPFPNNTTLTISSVTSYGRMCDFVQTDNTGLGLNVAAGTTLANVLRVNTYSTNTISNTGPGDSGTVTVLRNSANAGAVSLTGSSNGTYGNLIISNNTDYRNVWSNVAAGFWYSFTSQASGSSVPAGYNSVQITHSAAGSTNTATWYYDSASPGSPTFSNTSIALSTNVVSYSSTIPHLTSASQFRLKGNIAKLSGDMYYSSNTFITGGASGSLAAPSSVTYAQAGVTTPLARNLYVSSGSAYFETTSNVISGFGYYATNSPTLTAYNSYTSGSGTFALGTGILYKTGTSTNIEETSIPVTSVGSGSGNGYRIVNPGSTDTPSFTANATAFNSQTGPFYTYDATNVGSGSIGVIKFDQTNYSTGYFPVGPNLSGQGANQYFTFKFIRTSVSKFNISFTTTGGIAGLWVALPGSAIDTSSTLNGWLTMSSAYAGSGQPGAGTGGNGSNGCALGGTATLNTSGTYSLTATFGTVSSSSTASNEIYVRFKLTSGQSLTALSIVAATN